MRIVAVTPLYPPRSRVGAWLSTHECLRYMVTRGHDVTTVIQLGVHEPEYSIDGVRVLTGASNIERMIGQADVVVSHLGDTGRAARAAEAEGVPSGRLGHGGDVKPATCNGSALVVYNSLSFAEQVGWHGPQIVVHPPVWPEDYRTTPGDRVTLVNLSGAKGVGTFEALVDAMPDVRFLGVLGSYGVQATIAPRPNLDVIPPTTNMRDDVYARTRLLLMPSERETWGRVGVEAMCSGIPVIAHPTPGLRESLGAAGMFINRENVGGWARLIRRLKRPSSWQYASRLAAQRSAELNPARELELFAERVEALA